VAPAQNGEPDERLRRHYDIERELADRLRRAGREERRGLYSEVYDEFFRRVDLPDNAEAQRAQVGLLLRLLEPFLRDGGSALEIGAGSGELSLALARRLDRVWAVDAVDPGIDSSDRPAGFTFVPSTDLASVVEDGEVDVAVSCHFVEHLHPDDLQEHLGEVLDKLKPGGVYVVVTPNRLYGPHDISRSFSRVPQGFHLREYTHLELGGELRCAGFRPVRAIGPLGEPPGASRWWAVATAERALGAIPDALRRPLLERAPRRPPFRPLEQVKLAGFKPGRA
jgi:SAM-dependent methyltransferase